MPRLKRKSPSMIQASDKKRKKSARADDGRKKLENMRNSAGQKRRLSIAENLDIHRACNRKAQKRRLADPDSLNAQRARNREAQKRRLVDPDSLSVQRARNREAQKRRLVDPDSLSVQRARNREAQKDRLADQDALNAQRARNREAQRRRLADPDALNTQKARNREAQKRRLADPESLNAQRARNREVQKRRLDSFENLCIHKARNREGQRRRLSKPENRQKHRSRLISAQKRRLSNPEAKTVHQARLARAKKSRLSNPKKRTEYQLYDALRKRKFMRKPAHHAIVLQQLKNYYCRRKIRKAEHRRQKLFRSYRLAIKQGPSHVCDSCFRLWFKQSMKPLEITKRNKVFLHEMCINLDNSRKWVYLCSSCYGCAMQMKIPSLSLSHSDLQFPQVSDAIKKLSPCEERFLCPRLPFMQIREVFGLKQFEVRGRAVNVPTVVDNNVKILPRVPDETATVPVALKRKKAYKQNYMFEAVRPKVIIQAAEALQNSELFQHEGIELDITRFQSQSNNFIGEPAEESHNNEQCDTEPDSESENSTDDQVTSEEPEHLRGQVFDSETLLQSDAIVFAPGEGNRPLSLFTDEYVEAKSFIKIYGGKLVAKPKYVSYQDWVKSEIMRNDRRCASCIPKLFFSALKLRVKKVADGIGLCLRKSKCKSKNVTAKDLLDDSKVKNLILHDSGFKIFEKDRGSPAFFEDKKKDIFAMLRQLGPPTFFITLSPAETKWPELLVILSKTVDGKTISEAEALKLPYEEKTRLIREDPVTCARYVDHRMRELLKLMRKKDSFFREYDVVDFYFRVEYQMRGSPHFHGLLFLKNPPNYKPGQDNSNFIKFIDRFITVSNDMEEDLVNLQTHHHTFTCYKNKSGKKKCRFDIPFFPMKKTVILEPLDESVDRAQKKDLRKRREELQTLLSDIHKDKRDLSFEDFLTLAKCSENEYFQIVRSGIQRPTVFLKRSVHETMINPCNREMLTLHRANLDIQPILDAYACASYVLGYINKSRKGLSKLMYDAMEEVKRGNLSLKEKFRSLGNHFLNASEFGAQESVYYILGMPISLSSRVCIFINTSHPDKRVAIAKSRKDLQRLSDHSTDIFAKNIIDHYTQRPDGLEQVCLAKFAAGYNYKKSLKSTKERKGKTSKAPKNDKKSKSPKKRQPSRSTKKCTKKHKKDSDSNNPWLALRNNSGFIRKRRKDKVIRYVRFNRETHEDDFFREHLMLFVPWRNESTDLIKVDRRLRFQQNLQIIESNKRSFVYSTELEDSLFHELFRRDLNEGNDDDEVGLSSSQNEFRVFGAEHEEGDILVDMGTVNRRTKSDLTSARNREIHFPVPHLIDDAEYHNLMSTLNIKQRKYLLHVLHAFKTRTVPLHECVIGGAGVGKSRLIAALQQSLTRFFNTRLGTSLDLTRVLLCSFTGKAAYNIRGMTLSTTFILPHSQFTGDMPPLSEGTLNTVRSKLHDLQLVIIDEFSMVSSRMFQQIDARLKQIFAFRNSQPHPPFGGVSIILLGDLHQLKPVAAQYIFEGNSTSPYGPLIGNPLWDLFRAFELTEIMRQKEDADFASSLNNLAEGRLTDKDIKLFRSREVSAADVPDDAIRLFLSNAEVDRYNNTVLSSKEEVYEVRSIDTALGQGSKTLGENALFAVENSPTKDTEGLPTVLKLSPKIRYMMTINVNTLDGLVNGAVGVAEYIEKNEQQKPIRVWISFNESDVGRATRSTIKHWPHDVPKNCTPVSKVTRVIRPFANATVSVSRKQFPLVPSEGLTVYKSQGGTFPNVAVHLCKGMRRDESYVSFSRCPTLAGLYLIGKFRPPRPPDPYDPVTSEIRKLRSKHVRFSCLFGDTYIGKKTILYHNVQSLNAHGMHVKNDTNYMSSDILILAETWLRPGDNPDIQGFQICVRQDVHRPVSHAHGVIVLSKDTDNVHILYESSSEDTGSAHNLVALICEDCVVCTGYIPPSTPFSVIKEQFCSMLDVALKEKTKVLVVGDFNQNIQQTTRGDVRTLITILNSRQLFSKLDPNDPSTNEGTHIDIFFSNFSNDILVGYSESYFSYHKPIICVLGHVEDRGVEPQRQMSPPKCSMSLVEHGHTTSSKLQSVFVDGVTLYHHLKESPSISENIDLIQNLTEFVRRNTLYNRKKQSHTIYYNDDFQKIRTTGNGSCLYNAISLLLTGSECLMYALRALVSAHMIINSNFCNNLIREHFHDDTTTPISVLNVDRFAEIGEVAILAYVLGRNIDVFETGSNKWYRMSTSPRTSKNPLLLLLEGQHYSALKKIGKRYYKKESFQFPQNLPPFRVLERAE